MCLTGGAGLCCAVLCCAGITEPPPPEYCRWTHLCTQGERASERASVSCVTPCTVDSPWIDTATTSILDRCLAGEIQRSLYVGTYLHEYRIQGPCTNTLCACIRHLPYRACDARPYGGHSGASEHIPGRGGGPLDGSLYAGALVSERASERPGERASVFLLPCDRYVLCMCMCGLPCREGLAWVYHTGRRLQAGSTLQNIEIGQICPISGKYARSRCRCMELTT
jgi:hypothetical protein